MTVFTADVIVLGVVWDSGGRGGWSLENVEREMGSGVSRVECRCESGAQRVSSKQECSVKSVQQK